MFGGLVPKSVTPKSSDENESGPANRFSSSRRPSFERANLTPAVQKIEFDQLQQPIPVTRRKSLTKSPSISSVGSKSSSNNSSRRSSPRHAGVHSGHTSGTSSRKNSNPSNVYVDIPRHLDRQQSTSSEPAFPAEDRLGILEQVGVGDDDDDEHLDPVDVSSTVEFSDEALVQFLSNSRSAHNAAASPSSSSHHSVSAENREKLVEEMRLINKRANLSDAEKNDLMASALAIDTSKSARKAMKSYKDAAYERVMSRHAITDLDTGPSLMQSATSAPVSLMQSPTSAPVSRSDESAMSFSTAAPLESDDEDDDNFVKMVEEVERCRGRLLQKASYTPSPPRNLPGQLAAASPRSARNTRSNMVPPTKTAAGHGQTRISEVDANPVLTTPPLTANSSFSSNNSNLNSISNINVGSGTNSNAQLGIARVEPVQDPSFNLDASLLSIGDVTMHSALGDPEATAGSNGAIHTPNPNKSSKSGNAVDMGCSYENGADLDDLLGISGISLNQSLMAGSGSGNDNENVSGGGHSKRGGQSMGFSSSGGSMGSQSMQSEIDSMLSDTQDTVAVFKNSDEFALSSSADTDLETTAYIESLLAASGPLAVSSKAATSRRVSTESVPTYEPVDGDNPEDGQSRSYRLVELDKGLRQSVPRSAPRSPKRSSNSQRQSGEVVKSVTSYFDELLDSRGSSRSNSFRGSASTSLLEPTANAGMDEGDVRASFFRDDSEGIGAARLPPVNVNSPFPNSAAPTPQQMQGQGHWKDPSLRLIAATPSYLNSGPGSALRSSINPALYEEVGKSPSLFSPVVKTRLSVANTPKFTADSRTNPSAVDILGMYGTRHRSNVPPIFPSSPNEMKSPGARAPFISPISSSTKLLPSTSSSLDASMGGLDDSLKAAKQDTNGRKKLPEMKSPYAILKLSPTNASRSKTNIYIEAELNGNIDRSGSADGVRPKSGNGDLVDRILSRGSTASSNSSVSTNYLLYGKTGAENDHNMSFDRDLDRSFGGSFNFEDDSEFSTQANGTNDSALSSPSHSRSRRHTAPDEASYSRGWRRVPLSPMRTASPLANKGESILDTTIKPSRHSMNPSKQSGAGSLPEDDDDAEEEDVHVVCGPGQWAEDTAAVDDIIGQQLQFPRKHRRSAADGSFRGSDTARGSKDTLMSSLTDQTFQTNDSMTMNDTVIHGSVSNTMSKLKKSGGQSHRGLPGDSFALQAQLPPVNELSPMHSKANVKSFANADSAGTGPGTTPPANNTKALQQALNAGHTTGLRLARVPGHLSGT